MTQEELQQNIVKHFNRLPKNLQDSFSNMKWMEEVKNIAQKYSFQESQTEILATETTLLLLGIIGIRDYNLTVSKDLGLDKEIYEKVINDINNVLLKDIQSDIENAYQSNIDLILEEKYGGSKKIDERFKNLPKETQMAINESSYQLSLYSAAEKNKLNIEQMGKFEEVTTKVMLGIINPDNYQQELISSLNISKEQSDSLVNEVNEKIFLKIRELLHKHWNENNTMEDLVPRPPYKKDILENKSLTEKQPNILEDKITKPVVSDTSTSIHNLEIKKESADKSHDPYREII